MEFDTEAPDNINSTSGVLSSRMFRTHLTTSRSGAIGRVF